MLESLTSWIVGAVIFGTVIMFGALGEILTEKAGHLNLGVPGLMFIGGFASWAVAFLYESGTDEPSKFLMIRFSPDSARRLSRDFFTRFS